VPYNRISDWLFNVNDGLNGRTVEPSNRPTKISRWLQEYEGCLSAANMVFHDLLENNAHLKFKNNMEAQAEQKYVQQFI